VEGPWEGGGKKRGGKRGGPISRSPRCITSESAVSISPSISFRNSHRLALVGEEKGGGKKKKRKKTPPPRPTFSQPKGKSIIARFILSRGAEGRKEGKEGRGGEGDDLGPRNPHHYPPTVLIQAPLSHLVSSLGGKKKGKGKKKKEGGGRGEGDATRPSLSAASPKESSFSFSTQSLLILRRTNRRRGEEEKKEEGGGEISDHGSGIPLSPHGPGEPHAEVN